MKGGEIMQIITTLIVAIVANVVDDLICRWLYSKVNDDN